MHRKIYLILIFLISCLSLVFADNSLKPFNSDDRILILAPHPDDEAIGCAGIIQQALQVGAQVKICYLTNGDHNQFAFMVYKKDLILRKSEFIAMGQVRRKEAIKAMELLGLGKNNLTFLGYPDFGTFAIFRKYWQSKKPFRSLLTRIPSVPYKEDMSFGAAYRPENILNDLKCLLLDLRPTKIFVSHPADVNVDHKTFYLFLQVALKDLENQLLAPEVYPYLIHWPGWPLPRHYHPELSLRPPKQFSDFNINWFRFNLTTEQLEKKHQAILCYKSQTESSAFYLLSFARQNELFGDFKEINLKMPKPQAAKDITGWLAFKNKLLSFIGLDRPDIDTAEQENARQDQIDFGYHDDALLIWIDKVKETARRRAVMNVDLFGYSYKVPFASMPKIHIHTKYNIVHVYEAGKSTDNKGIGLDLFQKKLFLTIPLKALGDPDFILISVRSYTGALPMYYSGFRRINLMKPRLMERTK